MLYFGQQDRIGPAGGRHSKSRKAVPQLVQALRSPLVRALSLPYLTCTGCCGLQSLAGAMGKTQ